MKIQQILDKACVVASLQQHSREGVIAELAERMAAHYPGIDRDSLVKVLLDREKLGSTGIGNGVAIPHGKLAGLDTIIAGFGRSPEGIEFDSQDGQPAHLFFILIAPENAASLHLKALARLSRLLKESAFRDKLMKAGSAEELYQEIIGEDEKF